MAENLTDLVGWPVVHQYFRIDRARWKALPEANRAAAVEELAGLLRDVGAEDGM